MLCESTFTKRAVNRPIVQDPAHVTTTPVRELRSWELELLLSTLSEDESHRIAHFAGQRDADLRVIAYTVVRLKLSAALGVRPRGVRIAWTAICH